MHLQRTRDLIEMHATEEKMDASSPFRTKGLLWARLRTKINSLVLESTRYPSLEISNQTRNICSLEDNILVLTRIEVGCDIVVILLVGGGLGSSFSLLLFLLLSLHQLQARKVLVVAKT